MNDVPVILHVDDDESCLELSRSCFERVFPHVELITRDDADEAFTTLSVEPVDAVVSDSVHLADGTPFVEAARNAYPDVPIVLYTGSEFTDAAPIIVQAGVTEYVQKCAETTMTDLVHRVEQLIEEEESRTDTDRFRYTPPNERQTMSSTGSADSIDSFDMSSDTWTELARCDPTSVDELIATLVDVLGGHTDGRPLVELFDAEALAHVFSSATGDEGRDDNGVTVQLRLRLDTHEIVVTNAGLIASRPLSSA